MKLKRTMVVLIMILMTLALVPSLAEDYDFSFPPGVFNDILAQIHITPSVVETPQSVDVRIAIKNATRNACEVTLYSPSAEQIGEPHQLDPDQTVFVTCHHDVNQRTINNGIVVYFIKYALPNEYGRVVEQSQPIRCKINGNTKIDPASAPVATPQPTSEWPSLTADDFLADVEIGIKERIAYNESTPDARSSDEWSDLVQFELDRVSQYEGVDFGNKKFNELVKSYILGCRMQESAATFYDRSYSVWKELWNAGLKARSVTIVEFYENYGLDLTRQEMESYYSSFESGDVKIEFAGISKIPSSVPTPTPTLAPTPTPRPTPSPTPTATPTSTPTPSPETYTVTVPKPKTEKQRDYSYGITEKEKEELYYVAQSFVKSHLKSPSSAKFARSYECNYGKGTGNVYNVVGWVESQNSYGATIRETWSCMIERNGDHASLVMLDIGGTLYFN